MSDELKQEFIKTMDDFEAATCDDSDDDYMSDGEWLDVFFSLCCKIRDEIV